MKLTISILTSMIFLSCAAVAAEEKLKKGNYLVSVHTDDGDGVDRAKMIFKDAGAEDISTVSEATAPKA